MAQAARQNLRMQKELKLLLTDPPPGVSLSDDSSSSSSSFSLSNINANIKGPEGTVYANGVFRIKIQIPDRYPFQPPNVTFATPIYHPNIDNGGRICLDILNLPPKGAWQPSLNISTVLMSIGLLLSEPNPDDGLMCEASREYKYNKQTFDQKARSMTEKYARSIAGVGTTTKPSSPVLLDNVVQNQEPKISDIESTVEHKKLGRVSRKLSLESSQKKQEVNIAHTGSLFTNSTAVSDIDIHNGQLPCASKEGNASLSTSLTASSDPPQIMANKENNENAGSKKRLGIGRKLSLQPERSVSLKSPLLPLNENCDKKLPSQQSLSEKSENWTVRKKLGIGRKLSLGNSISKSKWEDDNDGNKENINPNYQFKSENEIEEEVIVSDVVIVMDSEDSDEEEVKVTRKSRLSIARKPLVGKRKAKT